MSDQRFQVFKLIEAMLSVFGSVTSRNISSAFGISESDASASILDYRDSVAPLLFDIKRFCHVPVGDWSPKILKQDPLEFLRALEVISPDINTPSFEDKVMSDKPLPCFSAKEIVELHNKCMKPDATEEDKRSLLDKFDRTKNRIALMTYQERAENPVKYAGMVKTRHATLTLINSHWLEYFAEKDK